MRRRDALKAGMLAFLAACTGQDTQPGPGETDTDPLDTDDSDVVVGCLNPLTPHGTEAEGWTRIPLSDHPEMVDKYNGFETTINGQRVSIAHVDDDCFSCVGTVCTHSGCAVSYRASRNQFVCPCHGAIYGRAGEVIAGPAPLPLPVHPTDFDGEAIWVLVT